MFVRRPVRGIVALWFEEEMTYLAAHHCYQPGNQRRSGGVLEYRDIGGKKTQRAQQM